MKYCNHCGKEIADEAVICPACGCSVQHTMPNLQSDSYSVLSILGLVFAFVSQLVGLILSIIAYNDAKKTGSAKSASLSKAGIIVSASLMGVGLFIGILCIIFLLVLGTYVGYVATGGMI